MTLIFDANSIPARKEAWLFCPKQFTFLRKIFHQNRPGFEFVIYAKNLAVLVVLLLIVKVDHAQAPASFEDGQVIPARWGLQP